MYLSASRIKTYHTCSWTYYLTYVLGFRDFDKSNDGAKRGTICHLILEVLLNPRHQKYIESVKKSGIFLVPSILRLVQKHAKILGVDDETNMGLMDTFIQVGLKSDYFCEGWDLQAPEKEFRIENEEPFYKILGYIDKHAISYDGEMARVDDYKTSKTKFTGKDVSLNIQSLLYALALWKEGGYKTVEANFIFLKFIRQPWQRFKYSEKTIQGFEYYLADIYKYLSDFNLQKACSNFARRNESFNLCGRWDYKPGDLKKDGSPAWVCPWRLPFIFYELVDKTGKVVKKSKEKQELLDLNREGCIIQEKLYAGCPAFRSK